MVLQPEGETPFPWLALITPGALFFLMALFWLLDISRYRLFCPLYLAGKGFSVITFISWLFFTGTGIIRDMLYGSLARYIAPCTMFFLFPGDLLSVWTVILIMKPAKEET
jgi:hypothetical protein